MAATFEQRMHRELLKIIESKESTIPQRLEATRYLMQIKESKAARRAKGKPKPIDTLDAMLGGKRG